MAILNEGGKAPRFTLSNTQNEKVSLADFKGKWLVLYFYPKDMTPGCTTQAQDFTGALNLFKKLKVSVVGVSKDSVERHQKFTEKQNLKIDLLADEEANVAKAYGVFKEKNLYGHKFMGIERTTFLIDPQGKVAKVYRKVKVKEHIKIILTDLKALIAK